VSFGVFYGFLVYFSRFGLSGNPGSHKNSALDLAALLWERFHVPLSVIAFVFPTEMVFHR
jgi:hypothetical protein